jgi:hypothetical protein
MPSRSLLLAGLLPLITLLCFQYSSVIIPALISSKNAIFMPRSKTPIIMASTPAFRSVVDQQMALNKE